MSKENKIADTELETMKVIWKHNGSVKSSDIVRELKFLKGWKETTIYTLISRLVEKGFLNQERKKHVSSYSPLITEQDYTLHQTHDFLDKMFGGDVLSQYLVYCNYVRFINQQNTQRSREALPLQTSP